ncbi:MAG TPA: cytochrome c [Nannocystis sp.]
MSTVRICAGLALLLVTIACATPAAEVAGDDPEALLLYGEEVYHAHCARCHGVDGRGDGPEARGLSHRPRDFVVADYEYKSTPPGDLPTDDDLDRTLVRGVIEEGMPSFRTLGADERRAVIHYIKSLADPAARPSAS